MKVPGMRERPGGAAALHPTQDNPDPDVGVTIPTHHTELGANNPPIPALLVGLWVFLKRLADEQKNINPDRMVKR